MKKNQEKTAENANRQLFKKKKLSILVVIAEKEASEWIKTMAQEFVWQKHIYVQKQTKLNGFSRSTENVTERKRIN